MFANFPFSISKVSHFFLTAVCILVAKGREVFLFSSGQEETPAIQLGSFFILGQYSSSYLPAQKYFFPHVFGIFSFFLVTEFYFLQLKVPPLDTFPISHWIKLQQ